MASRDSGLLFSLERGLGIALWVRQEKKALTSRGRGLLRGFLELRRLWGFSHEARRGSQGASRAVPGKSGLRARGEGERVMALESRKGTRAMRRVEEGLSRSFSGGGGKHSFPSPSAGDLRELPRVPLRGEASCGVCGASRDSSGSCATEEGLTSRGGWNLRLSLRFGLRPQGHCRVGTGESGLVLSEEGKPAGLSSCSGGLRPLVELCVEPTGLCGRCTGVAVPLRVVPSPTGLPSKRGPGLGSFSRADRGIGGVRHVAPPTWLVSNFLVRPAPS